MILLDWAPERAAVALEANKAAAGVLLSTLPYATLYDEPGLLWFETGIVLDAYNGVLQTNLSRDALPAAAERVLTHFQQRRLPFHWQVGPSSGPGDLGDLLEVYGIRHDEAEPGMAADLLSPTPELPEVSQLVIEDVLSRDRLRQWSQTTFCGAPPEAVECVFAVHSGLPLGVKSPIRLYLGTINGAPVATVKLFYASGVAYIGRVVTVPAFRRQGIGTRMTLHAMHTARQAGYRIAVLTASPMGVNIYRRLGFFECCTIGTYAWSPSSGENS